MDCSLNLFNAVSESNLNEVTCLIRKGVNVNCLSKSGDTPLHLALENGNTDIALLLIVSGSNINTKTEDDKSALFIAAQCNNVAVVRALLNRPSLNVNSFCYGKTALHVACELGHEQVVKELIHNYRTMFLIDVRFHNDLPLHVAANLGHVNITHLLLDKMTSVNSLDSEGRTPLWIALINKHGDLIRILVNHYRVNVNFRYCGNVALLHCISEHMEEQAKWLAERGADVKARDGDKRTVLHHSAIQGMPQLVDYFIARGADISAVDSKGYTPFHYAVTQWNLQVIQVFINNGVSVDCRLCNGDDFTPLQLAVKRGNFDVAKLLIESGADINAVDPRAHYARSRSGTLFHWACRNWYDRVAESAIKFLVENGAKVNAEESDGRTPISLLVKHNGKEDMMKYLIDSGAVLNTPRGGTPLYWALYSNYLQLLQFLIDNGTDVNAHIDNFDSYSYSRTALHIAREPSSVKLFIDKGASVHTVDRYGNTPLHYSRSLPVAKLFVQNHAHVNAVNFKGDTPLHYADSVHIAEFLIECRADVNATDHKGYTPLHMAKNVNIAQLLIENGADIRALTHDGKTVLHTAAKADVTFLYQYRGVPDLVDYFIEKGIDVNASDNLGNTPMKISALKNNGEVANRLLNNGATLSLFNVENNGCNIFYLKLLNDLFISLKRGEPYKKSMDLIRRHLPLNYKDDDTKSTLLHVAAQHNRRDFIEFLLKKENIRKTFERHCTKINVDACDIDGNTPLHLAAIHANDVKIVKTLLLRGATYNCNNTSHQTPSDVTDNSHIKIILNLVQSAFDAVNQNNLTKLMECIESETSIINARNENGCSLLHLACAGGLSNIVTYLVDQEADVTLVNNKKETVLHLASFRGDEDAVVTFMKHFSQPPSRSTTSSYNRSNVKPNQSYSQLIDFVNLNNTEGQTAVHIAAKMGFLNIVKILVKCGVVFNSKDNFGKLPRDYATSHHIETVFTTVHDIFDDAKNGNSEIVTKLENMKGNQMITSLTCNNYRDTLTEYLDFNGYKDLADEITKLKLLQVPEELSDPSYMMTMKDEEDFSDETDMDFGLFD